MQNIIRIICYFRSDSIHMSKFEIVYIELLLYNFSFHFSFSISVFWLSFFFLNPSYSDSVFHNSESMHKLPDTNANTQLW